MSKRRPLTKLECERIGDEARTRGMVWRFEDELRTARENGTEEEIILTERCPWCGRVVTHALHPPGQCFSSCESCLLEYEWQIENRRVIKVVSGSFPVPRGKKEKTGRGWNMPPDWSVR